LRATTSPTAARKGHRVDARKRRPWRGAAVALIALATPGAALFTSGCGVGCNSIGCPNTTSLAFDEPTDLDELAGQVVFGDFVADFDCANESFALDGCRGGRLQFSIGDGTVDRMPSRLRLDLTAPIHRTLYIDVEHHADRIFGDDPRCGACSRWSGEVPALTDDEGT